MALCDRLEAQLKERDVKQATLAKAALAKFTEDPSPENLQLLFHPSFSIEPEDLRMLVLNLAIKGKLVAQDPKDESAEHLFEKILTHKSGAKKTRAVSEVFGKPKNKEKDNRPIPDGWIWTSFGEIVVNRDGERIPVSKEIRETKAKVYDYYGASGVIDKIDSYLFSSPLLLIGEDGANLINRSTPIAFIARGHYWVNNHAHVLDGISEDFLKYLEIYINALAEIEYLQSFPAVVGGIRRGEEFYYACDLRPSSTRYVPEQGGCGEDCCGRRVHAPHAMRGVRRIASARPGAARLRVSAAARRRAASCAAARRAQRVRRRSPPLRLRACRPCR